MSFGFCGALVCILDRKSGDSLLKMTDRTKAVLRTVEPVVKEAHAHMEAGETRESIENFKTAAETIQSVLNSIEDLTQAERETFQAAVDEWLELARQQKPEGPKPIGKGEERKGAALMGAAAGLVAGGTIGLPIIAAAAGGVLAANALDREDKIGKGAEQVGKIGAKALRRASAVNKKYDISGRLKAAAFKAAKEAQKQLEKAGKHTGNAAGKLMDGE